MFQPHRGLIKALHGFNVALFNLNVRKNTLCFLFFFTGNPHALDSKCAWELFFEFLLLPLQYMSFHVLRWWSSRQKAKWLVEKLTCHSLENILTGVEQTQRVSATLRNTNFSMSVLHLNQTFRLKFAFHLI